MTSEVSVYPSIRGTCDDRRRPSRRGQDYKASSHRMVLPQLLQVDCRIPDSGSVPKSGFRRGQTVYDRRICLE
jgi:hypothetical protein